ncbi:MAG: mandelate racemase/muconate lactonizing enzyme family protein, partial [Chloroflexota bacterium]
VKTTLYETKMSHKHGDANSPAGRLQAGGLAVELTTDEGLTGVAFHGLRARNLIHSMCDSLLVGQDPRHVTGLWQRMVSMAFKGGHDGLVNDAIGALDIAMWDLKAKWNREPLWKTLGGARPKALGYASGLDMPLSDDELFEFYSGMADHGFKGGKLKVGLDQDMDIRRIGVMRSALKKATDDPMLLIDANEYWNPKQAIRKVREIEEQFDITWIEEPARRWDFLGLRRISEGVNAAVCAGENLDTLGDFLPYFHNHSVDVIQVGAGMTGITCALQIADAAYGFELPVTLGGSAGNCHAHLATAMPNFMIQEIGGVDPGPIFTTDVRVEDGWMIPGDKPGLGLEINQEELQRHAVEKLSPVSGPSPFGRRQGAGLYEVPPTEEEIATARSLG